MRSALRLAVVLAALVVGCGRGYEVMRVHDGRARAERFVSPDAYVDSLEASLAEQRGDWAAAAEWLRRARDEDPDALDLQARYGLALCRLGKRDAAMFAFADAIRGAPELERAYTARAQCRLLAAGEHADATALVEVRADLERGVIADSAALEPALLLIDLDVHQGAIARARARAEELVAIHPGSATALRIVAEIAARQGDVGRAVAAARAATAIDAGEGAKARRSVLPIAEAGGASSYALALRGVGVERPGEAPQAGACATLWSAFERAAGAGAPSEIAIAADGVRGRCPELDGAVTLVEAQATWSPERAEALEARALSSTSPAARRWGLRARLRRLPVARLLEPDALPAAEDRASLALQIAARALRRAQVAPTDVTIGADVDAARTLAPAEPTVARLLAEIARSRPAGAQDPARRTACALARTEVEKQDCAR